MAAGSATATPAAQAVANIAEDNLCMIRTSFVLAERRRLLRASLARAGHRDMRLRVSGFRQHARWRRGTSSDPAVGANERPRYLSLHRAFDESNRTISGHAFVGRSRPITCARLCG